MHQTPGEDNFRKHLLSREPIALTRLVDVFQILQSVSRVPSQLLEGKTLKLIQVLVKPGNMGFGIDLTEFNGVANILASSPASNSDLEVGDIVVSVNGVDLGDSPLLEKLQPGCNSYIFNVIRPAIPTAGDDVVQVRLFKDSLYCVHSRTSL